MIPKQAVLKSSPHSTANEERGGFSDAGKNNQIEDFFTAPLGDISLQLLYSADLSKR